MRTSSTSEQSNLTQTQVGLRQMLEGKDLLAAPAKSQDRSHAAPAPKVAESQIKGMVNQVMQLRCYLKAKLKPMRRLKPSQRRQPGASLRIPRVTRARSTFVASSISLISDAETVANVPSVIPRRLRKGHRPRAIKNTKSFWWNLK